MDRSRYKKAKIDKYLELVYHGIDPSILDKIPPEFEQYFWEELSHITELKKAERNEQLITAAYLGHIGTINHDPRATNKTPAPFFGSKIMGKEIEGLSAVASRLRRHLSGDKKLSSEEREELARVGYDLFKHNRYERVEVTLQNGDKLIRNVARW